MSLSSGPTGGKGVDSNAVDTYDSGDEWDIGVGNLIIDLDADLEKDKLEMSSGKEGVGGGGGGGNMGAPPTSAVAALPDNIKFVSPVATHGKESKSKSKRSKNSKESAKAPQAVSVSVSDGGSAAKKDIIQQGSTLPSNPNPTPNSTPTKGGDKPSSKSSRALTGAVKKDKEGGTGKSKKVDKMDAGAVVTSNAGVLNAEKESAAPVLPFEGQIQNPDLSTGAAGNEQQQIMGNMALDSLDSAAGIGLLLPPAVATEQEEEVENNNGGECRSLKKVVGVKIESPVSTPTAPHPPPLHLPAATVATNNNNNNSSSDSISLPCEQMIVRTRSVGSNTADVSMGTEPECLGPCEPGTSVNLEGIVWQETEDGMLVVNVTWRNKTYVGTLLDCTRHDWAPPRFCESPTSDVEMRSGRGRGKRMRPGSNTPVNDNSNSSDNKGSGSSKTRGAAAANNSKGRRGSQPTTTVASCGGGGGGLNSVNIVNSGPLEEAKASPSSAKRKAQKTNSDMEPTSSSEDTKGSKRMRTNSTGGAAAASAAVGAANLSMLGVKMDTLPPPPPQQLDRTCSSPVLIDCPHPNCNKKYKHINGLKYHQARAHNDHDVRIDQDMDSEYGDDSSSLHPDTPASCNGANSNSNAATNNANSPARSTTPKGRGFDAPSPSPGKKGKKKLGEVEIEMTDACEDNACLTDEASNDGIDDRKAKKLAQGGKADKLSQKGLKPGRPGAQNVAQNAQTSPYAIQANSPALGSIVQQQQQQQPQPIPKSPQLKANQPNKSTTAQLPDPASSPTLLAKEKKKKDKKKRDSSKEGDSPKGKGCEAKSPYSDTSDSLLNGSNDQHQSRLASIKAEADKVYSFSDNAPSPSIGVGSRMEGGQNGGADNASVKTSSPAYSDISDAGEDGEGKADTVKVKTEPADPAPREGAKKALFPPQPPGKDQPYYPAYDSYYSPTYPHPSPGNQASTQPPTLEGAQVKKEEEEHDVSEDNKLKMEPPDERKPDISLQHHHHQHQQQQQQQQAQQIQPSVIQQRSNMYNQQPLYYNQYYVPPYSYTPDQAYHAHLLASNPAYRQQYEERKKSECKEVPPKIPPTLSRAPSLTDLKNQSKSGTKESGAMASTHNMHSQQAIANANANSNVSSEQGKSSGVIMAKGEESGKGAAATVQPEGLKMKLSEAVHHGKDEGKVAVAGETGRPAGVEQAMWYRQEPDSRLWPYVYPNKYSDAPKPSDEDRWKEERERERERERDRERERKTKDERQQHKAKEVKEEVKELALSAASADDQHSQQQQQAARVLAKEQRPPAHMQFPSAMAQHQGYMPYMHHGPYAYSHAAYEPTHPGYRGMPSVMMAQNYPASYLPPGYSFPSSYGGKVEESDKPSRSSPTVKQPGESKALDLLQQHASQYKSKSPSIQDNKQPHERERDRDRDRDRERERDRERDRERERDEQRPRSSPSQRIMQPSHHHLGYPLLSGQYDLSYASGLSSSAIVASQQASAPSMYPPPRR